MEHASWCWRFGHWTDPIPTSSHLRIPNLHCGRQRRSCRCPSQVRLWWSMLRAGCRWSPSSHLFVSTTLISIHGWLASWYRPSSDYSRIDWSFRFNIIKFWNDGVCVCVCMYVHLSHVTEDDEPLQGVLTRVRCRGEEILLAPHVLAILQLVSNFVVIPAQCN